MAIGAAGFAYIALGIPDTRNLWRTAAGPSITVVDVNGTMLATRGAVYGDDVALSQMSRDLPLAVMAIEDRRFYSHWGLDPIGVARALFTNMEEGRIVEGGSTITQQLAKNVFLTHERTFKRKLQEALLALWLEWRFTKDEILTLYLNRVYFGAGTYGVEAAARRYFDKAPLTLTLSECALLAGLLKAPSRFAPTNEPARADRRARVVLDAMLAAGFITPETHAQAIRHPAEIAPAAQSSGAQYFVDWVLDTLPDIIESVDGELIVETTLHLPFQRAAENVVAATLNAEGEAQKAREAALVSIGRDGAVLAMIGGRGYDRSQFNRATQARRQPGSAFKPFVYLAALEHGRTPSWRMRDAPINISGWQPANFDRDYRGDVTLQTALAQSINTIAIRLAETIGRQAVIETAARMGIQSPLMPVASLALGTQEVGLLELTGAYLPFATGGEKHEVYAVTRVRTKDGRVIFEHKKRKGAPVIEPRHAGAMNAMLREAIRQGTGRAAYIKERDAAGKTGTSQDFRDAWFVGYTADLVTGVWVGNDDGSPTRHVTGGGLPAKLWHDYMEKVATVYEPHPLPDGGYQSLVEYRMADGPRPVGGGPDPLLAFFKRIGSILGNEDRPDGTPKKEKKHKSPGSAHKQR